MSLSLDDIDAILITHTHKDHIAGLKVLAKHTNTKFYIQEGMYKELKEFIPKEQIEFLNHNVIINKLHVFAFQTSHDAPDSCGFLLEENDATLVYVTDTGYLPKKYFKGLKNKRLYFIEANHDEEMLMNGPYPYYLKQRVIGDKGHLSNNLTARYLKELVGEETKNVVLAHLSEHNNEEHLAIKTITCKLEETEFTPRILVARQNEETELIEV